MKNVLCLSHPIGPGTPLYGGHSGIELKKTKDLCSGDSCNTLWLSMPNHVSTHVDAPSHFIDGGRSLTDFPPSFWVFDHVSLWSFPVAQGTLIGEGPECAAAIGALDPKTELLLIRTGFESFRGTPVYWEKSPGLSAALADVLLKRCPGLRAVGIDIISISSPLHRERGREAHREFLSREILLVEDMSLIALSNAPGRVVVAPMLLEKADGAPVTVFAFQ